MKAAHIVNGKVVNYCMVASYDSAFVDPKDSVLGDLWDGSKFTKPIKSLKEVQQEFSDIVQNILDSKAKEKHYDNIISACSYAGAPNPFQAESQAFLSWRGDVWQKCYELLAAVEQGISTVPTVEQLIAELPTLVLPVSE
jgi:hypothetical protein